MSYSGQERRRSQRVIYPFEVWYKDYNKSSQGFKHAYGKDISEHGLRFETYENFLPCTILELRFDVILSDSLVKTFNLLAEVVRSEEVRKPWLYNICISFCKIDTECKDLIKEYVHKQFNEFTLGAAVV